MKLKCVKVYRDPNSYAEMTAVFRSDDGLTTITLAGLENFPIGDSLYLNNIEEAQTFDIVIRPPT